MAGSGREEMASRPASKGNSSGAATEIFNKSNRDRGKRRSKGKSVGMGAEK